MNIRKVRYFTGIFALTAAVAAHAQGTAFSYQGHLNDGASPATGLYDLQFTLYDAATGGSVVAGPLSDAATGVTNGLFSLTLDFGANFPGANRWLEINVRTNGGGAYSTLSPRQEILPTPYAITAENLNGILDSGSLSGTYSSALVLNNPANQFNGIFSGNGSGLNGVNALTLDGFGAGQFWQLTGNAGTTAGLNFLGTIDFQPLELQVNATRALRLEPTTIDANHSLIVNVLGGSPRNFLAPGIYGATIAGGGARNYMGTPGANSVLADFGTVGGGLTNTSSGLLATVAGGGNNLSSATAATVGGGAINTSSGSGATVAGGGNNISSGPSATVGGGSGNTSSGNTATVAGGNLNASSATYATVGGGNGNSSSGNSATVAGGANNQSQLDGATVGGGQYNTSSGLNATVAGGNGNLATGDYASVGGGQANSSGGYSATIAGGDGNIATNLYSTVAGGFHNVSSGPVSAVGAGANNWATAEDSAVGAGLGNMALNQGAYVGGGINNTASGNSATVGGGLNNTASDIYATVAGGWFNQAKFWGCTIGGGYGNIATGSLPGTIRGSSTVGGGVANSATEFAATISGGANNFATWYGSLVCGGQENQATNSWSTVAGGRFNWSGGTCSFAAGTNVFALGDGSLAAGTMAVAQKNGTFVWADQTPVRFDPWAVAGPQGFPNSFNVRSTAGVYFVTGVDGSGNITSGVTLAGGSGSWASYSDRNAKTNFASVNTRDVLERLVQLPVETWNYKAQSASIRHMGPMAQDFAASFGLGDSDRTITSVDADGVALAAIKGLNEKLEERLAEQSAELKARESQLEVLTERLTRLEQLLEQQAARH